MDMILILLLLELKKIAQGHRGFEVTTNSNLSFDEASLRRDFTINSIGYNFFEKSF